MSETPLPAERAFVVQLRGQPRFGEELFVGRIEHIASGTAGRFASVEGLIDFIRQTLAPEPPLMMNQPGSTAKGARRT